MSQLPPSPQSISTNTRTTLQQISLKPRPTVLLEGLGAMIQGLAREFPRASGHSAVRPDPQHSPVDSMMRFPLLEQIFSQAELVLMAPQSAEQSLWALLGQAETAVPVAAAGAYLELAADDPQLAASTRIQGRWLRADPVWLRADINRVFLAADALGLREDEHQQLADYLAPYLAEAGWQLHRVAARWYVRRAEDAAPWGFVLANPNHQLGRDLNDLLPSPRAADQHAGHQLFNELQMLLFQHPLNQARRTQGLPEANSLWFWGAGAWPESLHCPYQVHSSGRDAAGACGMLLRAVQATAQMTAQASIGPGLWHWSPQAGERPSQALQALQSLLEQAALQHALAQPDGLCFIDDEGHYWHFSRAQRPRPWQPRYWQLRYWRRPQTLAQVWQRRCAGAVAALENIDA